MKTALATPAKPAPEARSKAPVDGHRRAQEAMVQGLAKSGNLQAADKLNAFYAKHPMRGPRKGELSATELVRQARDGGHRR